VSVIEVAQNFAGPLAAQILADLGADVIKVEKPDGGDDARGWGPPFVEGAAVSFHVMNRNKRAVTLDLRSPADLERLRTLVARADIFIHNLRPGAAEALGFGPDDLMALNPRLIYCVASGFGDRGPLASKPGYEILLQAFAGLMSVTGEADGPPVRMGTSVNDFGTGMWTALGALAALQQRERTGRGCVVSTSLLETALFWLCRHHAEYRASGVVPERHATGGTKLVGFRAFETSNGPIVIAPGNDRLFARLATVIGHAEWNDDPRYRRGADRFAHREHLTEEIQKALLADTKERWMERLEAAGVPCAPILTVPEVLEEPQVAALDILYEVPGIGLDVIGLPMSFDGRRPPVRRAAPALGQDNGEVLEER
jgi:formyl-CoA transferase